MRRAMVVASTVLCWVLSCHWGVAETFEDGRLEVYISTHADLQQGKYVLEEEIVRFIDEAEQTLDIAVQELRSGSVNLESHPIKDAILSAAGRGVQVRVILEKDYLTDEPAHANNRETYDELAAAANVAVRKDGNSDTFHDKFVVRDPGHETAAVLTGSTNFTDTGTRRNYNHILIIHFPSPESKYYDILGLYKAEFQEAWTGTYGNHVPAEKVRNYSIGSARVTVMFSPDNDPDDLLMEKIVEATQSLDLMMFVFGSNSPMLAGIINRFYTWQHQVEEGTRQTVEIRVGTESLFDRYWSACPPLRAVGVKVGLETNPDAKLHHKVAVIDGDTVVLGSYNWTRPANERNDENVVIIRHTGIAQLFTEAFDELWEARVVH